MEMSVIPITEFAVDCIPNGSAHTFLLLHAQVKHQLTILGVPVDLAPIAPTHDKLLFPLSAVRIFREKRDLWIRY